MAEVLLQETQGKHNMLKEPTLLSQKISQHVLVLVMAFPLSRLRLPGRHMPVWKTCSFPLFHQNWSQNEVESRAVPHFGANAQSVAEPYVCSSNHQLEAVKHPCCTMRPCFGGRGQKDCHKKKVTTSRHVQNQGFLRCDHASVGHW